MTSESTRTDLPIPLGASVTVWLTACRQQLVSHEHTAGALSRMTLSDSVLNAMGELISWHEFLNSITDYHATLSLPIPGDPCGVPTALLPQIDTATGVISLSPQSVLVADHELRWSERESVHTITPLSMSEARRMFVSRMTRAEKVLTELHSIGDAKRAEDILRSRAVMHLPRNTPSVIDSAIEQASAVRALIDFGMTAAQVMDSRSGDTLRMNILRELDHSARMYLCAAASSPF